ncbi:uncharacterized protein LOC110706380 [Chenopodium quinoa]|uniref:uncharacterized protein LOC110706380 n=1 Tax=Chenopodium quinoa TaxID=63459 RepID=UPI000B78D7C0|nr:uncharacterized protein LOC110706380 [Chenopodium quinoa]
MSQMRRHSSQDSTKTPLEIRFRSVCKSWYTLITHSHEFQLCHLNSKSTHPRRLVCFMPRNFFPVHTTDCFWVFDESLTSKKHLPCHLPLEDREPGNFWKTQVIGSSHGVCCLFHPDGDYYQPERRWMQEKYFMFLWNPSIRKYKVDHPLHVPSRDRYRTMSMLMGFGYASNDRDHKIIVITTDEHGKDRVFLYSLRTSSWTEIRLRAKLKYWGRLVTEDDSGTYFNGAFHWVVYTSDKSKGVINCPDNYHIMVCFHVERQELYYFDLVPMQMEPYKGQGRSYQPLVYKNMLSICDIMGYEIPDDPTPLSIRLWCKKA